MNYDTANSYDRRVSKIMVAFIVANMADSTGMKWHGTGSNQ